MTASIARSSNSCSASRKLDMPGHDVTLNRGLLMVLMALLLAGGLLATSGSAMPARAYAAELDTRIPGPSNPVGPTDWNRLVVQPSFVVYDSGLSVTVENIKFLQGFQIRNGTQVTMRNCHVINPDSFWTVFVPDGSLLMEDCQIGDDETTPGERGVGGDNVTLRRVKIVGHTDD